MKNKKLVNNYAKALFEVANNSNQVDEISKQVFDVKNILANTSKHSIKVHNAKIIELFHKTNLHPVVKNFIVTIIKNNRVQFISPIVNRYLMLAGKKNNFKYSVTIFLPEKNEKKLEYIINMIENKVCTLINPRIIIDESLMKGAAIQINGILINSSFKSKIKTLKSKSKIIKNEIYQFLYKKTLSKTLITT